MPRAKFANIANKAIAAEKQKASRTEVIRASPVILIGAMIPEAVKVVAGLGIARHIRAVEECQVRTRRNQLRKSCDLKVLLSESGPDC